MEKGKKLGEGTFGIVYSCKSPSSGKHLAFKRNLAERNTSFMVAVRELHLLTMLRGYPYIVYLDRVAFGVNFAKGPASPLQCSKDRKSQRDDDIHFVFEQTDCDLHGWIYGSAFVDFATTKLFMVQMLLALEYIHACGIIHRDIKPSNVLVYSAVKMIKICDFGLAKPYTRQGSQTPKVVTSLYRPPEITLGCPNYGYVVDVWAMGCVFLEMISKRPFINANTEDDDIILSYILAALPKALPISDVRRISNSNQWRTVQLKPFHRNDKRHTFFEKMGLSSAGSRAFSQQVGSIADFVDLLDNMIKFDWNKRYTATQCLNHKFFNDYRGLINDTRLKFTPVAPSSDKFELIMSNERKWMGELAIGIYNDRATYYWYTHRILFQAMDLFDRYLSALVAHSRVPENAIESDIKGLYHTKAEIELRFQVCLYLSIKYFSTVHYPVHFSSIMKGKGPEIQKIAQQFEGSLVQHVLKFKVYRPTLYEVADQFDDLLSEDNIRDLIILYVTNPSINGLTTAQLYSHYKKNMMGRRMEELFAPFSYSEPSSAPPLTKQMQSRHLLLGLSAK